MTVITEATVDLNIILDSLVDNDFVDSTEAYADVNTVEYSKVNHDGSETVFALDFNTYIVTKDCYNNKGVRLSDASSRTVVKYARDLEVLVNSIV